MKKFTGIWMATAVAGACLIGVDARPSLAAVVSPNGFAPQPAVYAQDRDRWDATPEELDEISRRGFHEGIEGARRDYENHRRPDVNNRDEFRHPPVHERDREAYRHGFERGYRVGVEHFYNGR